MACFEAKRLCPRGVLCRPHYDEYRRLSAEMFHILEEYSPTLVPISIDEGFLDFTTMDRHVWRDTTPEKYVKEICERILREVKLPVSAGLANSSRLAKLATDAAKPGFIEVPPGSEKEFLQGPFRARTFRHRQKPATRAGRARRDDVRPRGETAVDAAPAEVRHLGHSNSGCSPTACGTSRCCWRSRTARRFPATPRCLTTSRITRRR